MSDYTDDYTNFVTVSPPPFDRDDKDLFMTMDQTVGLNQPDLSHQQDFSNLQNNYSKYNQHFDAGLGGSFNTNSNGHFNQNHNGSAGQSLTQNLDDFSGSGLPTTGDAIKSEFDGSLMSPNSSSSYDQSGLNRLTSDSNQSVNTAFDSNSFLFSNPNPNISSSNLLSPNNFGPYSASTSQGSTYSNSAYSDVSSNANVPFHDALSQFSASPNYAAADFDPSNSYFEPIPPQLQDSFSQEISLGQSISSTNLSQMARAYDSTSGADYSEGQVYGNYTDINQQSFQLTENNLSNYNDENKVTISIQEAPEVVAQKTPSLFSNSSHNSSNTPGTGTQPASAQPLLQRPDKSYNSVPSTPSGASPALSLNSPLDPGSADSQYLNPEDFQNIRRGRQSAHSRKVHSRSNSRSRSRSRDIDRLSGGDASDDDSEYDDEKEQSFKASSAREKMLELANAPVVTKRTQIHPSLYACNLCEKRFTRPYNLKSHLRTHTDERPYICNVCGKAFARQHDKKRHEELHSGEKKFQCKGVLRDGTEFGCSRKFARADALRRHFQTEAGKACIRLLVEEEQASQNKSENLNSGIQLPDGKFTSSYFPDVPMVSVQSPKSDND